MRALDLLVHHTHIYINTGLIDITLPQYYNKQEMGH